MPTREQMEEMARKGFDFGGGGGVIGRMIKSGEIRSADVGLFGEMPAKECEENILTVSTNEGQA